MKDIKVSELKANLSKYLRMASQGERLIVRDRDEPIAQIIAPDRAELPWMERMAREGRLRLPTREWGTVPITPLERDVDIQAALQDVREDPSEVRRR